MKQWNRKIWMPVLSAALAIGIGTAASAKQPSAPAPPDPADPVHVNVQGQAIIVDRDGNQRVIQLDPGQGQFAFSVAQAGGADANQAFWVGRAGKMEKAPFLGVVSSPADPSLRAQLKLPRGIGLVIQQVQPGTPAEAAGLQEHDIITKIDDQWLVTSQQLGILIRMHKPDDEVTLTGIREGQPLTIKAKLGEREMVVPDTNEPQAFGARAFNVPGVFDPDRLRELTRYTIEDDAALIIRENDQTMKVSVRNGERHLVVTDNNEQTLFDGPVETDEQRNALPPDIADRLEKYKDQFDEVKDTGPGQRKVKIVQEKK